MVKEVNITQARLITFKPRILRIFGFVDVIGFGVGASNIPCLDFYKGEGPESEPETKVI